MLRRAWARIKSLWLAAKNERAEPREIGWAVALGVFAGCTPAVGFHGGLALLLATIFKKNRLFCWIGSRIANAITLPFVVLAEVQLAHRLRTGTFLALDRAHILDHGTDLLLDWALGTVPVGGALAAVVGWGAYLWARRRAARRRAADDASATDDRSATGDASSADDASATDDVEAPDDASAADDVETTADANEPPKNQDA
ncbi:MAG: DUF2062 domain-containing protein [Polyangiaceae bacterium]